MMGLQLGMSKREVMAALDSHRLKSLGTDDTFLVQFKNSPKLIVELDLGGILLRDAVSKHPETSVFDEMFAIGFKGDELVHLLASQTLGATLDYYRGSIFGEVKFGTPVSKLTKYCALEFDDEDELFHTKDKAFAGLSVGGSSASIEDDPEQLVSYIRIYKPE
jgi:hypothetical protein